MIWQGGKSQNLDVLFLFSLALQVQGLLSFVSSEKLYFLGKVVYGGIHLWVLFITWTRSCTLHVSDDGMYFKRADF